MAEVAEVKQEEKKPIPGNLVSAGVPVRGDFTAATIAKANEQQAAAAGGDKGKEGQEGKEGGDGAGQELSPEQKEAATKAAADVSRGTEGVTEDQMKAYLKANGIEVDGLDSLKQKLATPAKDKTPEEIKQAEVEKEQKLLAAHMKRGGTIEQFTTFKQLVSADPKELGLNKAQQDLIQEGFSPEDANLILKKMHLQYTEEEIAELTPEQVEALKKQSAFGLKKQESRGKYIQQTAKSYLDSLEKEVADQESVTVKAAKHTSKVEDAISKFQRKQTLQLGEYNGQTLDPVDYDVPETVLAQVKEIIQDPAKLEKQLYNEDGSVNLDFLVPHLVASVSRETAVKHSLLTGQTRQVEIFQKKYGSTMPELGSGKQEKGQAGKIVSAGKPEIMKR